MHPQGDVHFKTKSWSDVGKEGEKWLLIGHCTADSRCHCSTRDTASTDTNSWSERVMDWISWLDEQVLMGVHPYVFDSFTDHRDVPLWLQQEHFLAGIPHCLFKVLSLLLYS